MNMQTIISYQSCKILSFLVNVNRGKEIIIMICRKCEISNHRQISIQEHYIDVIIQCHLKA